MKLGAYLVKRTILLAFYLLFILLATRAVFAQEKGWQETINAAKKEGKVVIYAGHPFRGYYSMLRAFKKAYPGRVEGRPYFDGDNAKFVDRRPADRLLDKIFRK